MPVGPHDRAGHEEPGQLVDRVQRALHRAVARDAQEIGVRRDAADHLRRRVAALELGHDRPRVAGLRVVHVREALVVGVVEQSGDAPELLVLAALARRRRASRPPRRGSGGAAIRTRPTPTAGTMPHRAKPERTWLSPYSPRDRCYARRAFGNLLRRRHHSTAHGEVPHPRRRPVVRHRRPRRQQERRPTHPRRERAHGGRDRRPQRAAHQGRRGDARAARPHGRARRVDG